MTGPMISNDPIVVELGGLKGRVNLGHDHRLTHVDDDDRFLAGTRRWSTLREDYLRLLRECVEGTERDTLTSARDELVARLERGLTMPTTDEINGQLFTLLARYEAVCDALEGLQAATRRLNRLDQWAVSQHLYATRPQRRTVTR